ncbi:putative porin [Paraburkholderia sp. BL6665CI2N2]|uniref:porin n=1 Tax=Paraburkholderia sp. BL6665CI2N2 TaxID=1938806 RepID=UPI0010658DA7|nr:porin [Paraburkholderia sp. BL6665CI2N2]TDY16675.1 putative porin [Paraburkholderia sp. BL6665CI2N2]
MKKILIASLVNGALGCTLAPVAAVAQSSVTLYGLIDEGVNYTSNTGGHSNVQMQSGFAQGSRWGLKGADDLGSGTKAIFQLENGFDVNSGKLDQSGRMFGRQAYVGLSSQQLGTLTMGRQYDSVVDYLAPLTANGSWAGYMLSHPYDNDNTDNSFRLNNSVKYTSNTYGGITFGGLYGFSNQAGGFANNRSYSFGAQYVGAAVTVAAAYMQINNPGGTAGGSLSTDDTDFFAGRQQVWGAGLNYRMGPTTLGAVYSHTTLNNATGSVYVGSFANAASSLKFDNFEVNAKYQFTKAAYVGAMYNYTIAHFNSNAGDSKPKYHQFGLMVDYTLSTRTDVYAQGMYLHASGGGPVAAPLNTAYITGADAPSSSANQALARVGIRHTF